MTPALARAQTPTGAWLPAYDHGGATVTDTCAQPPSIRQDFNPANKFNALHASLIPTGPHQGHVMVWDHLHYHGDYKVEKRTLQYSIINPGGPPPAPPPVFYNHIGCFLPSGKGDLFCAGHGWNAEGDLVIAGGSTVHKPPAANWGGAALVYVWTPPATIDMPGTWRFPQVGQQQDYLVKKRWYPAVVALCPHSTQTDQDRMLILGGIDGTTSENTYECWEKHPQGNREGQMQIINTTRVWAGPTPLATFALYVYPRTHTLSTNLVATAGFSQGTARLEHPANPGVWETNFPAWFMANYRHYGSSVLHPISTISGLKDQIVAIGGANSVFTTIYDTVDICDAAVNPPSLLQWTPLPPLLHKRHCLNTVLLPDATMLVVGGEKQNGIVGCSDDPALVPEVYVGGGWSGLAPSPFIRDYHSCALLLPDGSVFVSGGESRHHTAAGGGCPIKGAPHNEPADYQIFHPPYLTSGNPRPTFVNAPMAGAHWEWGYETIQSVTSEALPPGVAIDKITLLRPGSVTHHADPNQRCVELTWQVVGEQPNGDQAINVTVPSRADNLLPRGFYMLFLVTNQGTPSFAVWVKIK